MIVIGGSTETGTELPTFTGQEPLRFNAEVSDQAKEDVTGNGNAALVIHPGTHRDPQFPGEKRRAMCAK
jgi:hypothetical protein